MLIFCDFIQVYILTINHHLNHMGKRTFDTGWSRHVCSKQRDYLHVPITANVSGNVYVFLKKRKEKN